VGLCVCAIFDFKSWPQDKVRVASGWAQLEAPFDCEEYRQQPKMQAPVMVLSKYMYMCMSGL
jgi:hypothetical protein